MLLGVLRVNLLPEPRGQGVDVYIAMNRFQVTAGREADFEEIWASRETYLDEV